MGEDCRMLAQHKSSADDTVVRLSPRNQGKRDVQDFFLQTVIQSYYIDSNRTDISNTLFTLPYPGYDIVDLSPVQEADVINLHWIAGFQSLITLHRLFCLGKPIVWTLHDQWAFTGGCHYSAGCLKYRSDCLSCPQLADDPWDVSSAVLRDKLTLWTRANLTIVTPSRWLAACARESRLFQDCRVEVIPNSLEVDLFHPLPKRDSKEKIGVPPVAMTILFGAVDNREKRKGFQVLAEAVHRLKADPGIKPLIEAGHLKILCFGHPAEDVQSLGIPVLPLGYLDSTEKISLVYSAADLFILPSLEDNLPNTMLEAMSCGTPVVGSNIGGIPDAVKEGVTGWLVQPGNAEKLGEAIRSALLSPQKLEEMGRNCRLFVETEYSMGMQAQRYMDLYQDLWEANLSQESKTANRSVPSGVKGFRDESNGQPANLETALGPNFYRIYDFVLFKALKEFAPRVQEQLSSSETDRAACRDQITNLTLHLQESEADRVARLEVIHRFGHKIDELNGQVNVLNEQIGEWKKNFFFRVLRKFHLLSSREQKGAPSQTPENSKAPLNPESPNRDQKNNRMVPRTD
jgi:glycosyltransferase involved in cell wall biosynthesis